MSETTKPKAKLMTADPLGVTAKLVGGECLGLTGDGILKSSGGDYGAVHDKFMQMLPAVMVVQAINRLTEAVQESTETQRQLLNLQLSRG